MGTGIAQLSASRGLKTILYDFDIDAIDKAKTIVGKNLQSLVEKKKIDDDARDAIFDRIHFTSNINECKAEMIIEAIVEHAGKKIALFDQLTAINQNDTIFATNTSSLSVTEIASKVTNPQRVIGMHFFNPAPVMKLVEVVKAEKTAEDVVETVKGLAERFGKVAVVCKDSPGFIVNRVARPYYLESLRLVEEHAIDVKIIDELFEATGFKLGPFKLMDLIGNDINYAVSCSVYEQMNKPERLKPSLLQKRKVDNGELGIKTGKGYYDYKTPGK